MTARADISNHRRKVLEERQMERFLGGRGLTAWEKGEAKPPFYREVLEEGVRRGDVVSKSRAEELRRVIEASGDYYKELEIKLREAEGRIEALEGLRDSAARAIGLAEGLADGLERRGVLPKGVDLLREEVARGKAALAGTEKEQDG